MRYNVRLIITIIIIIIGHIYKHIYRSHTACGPLGALECGEAWHLERRSVNDWVTTCKKRWRWQGRDFKGKNRKTWKECADDDMEVLGLHPEWVLFRDVWRDFIWANEL